MGNKQLEPLLIGVLDACRMLGISRAKYFQMKSAGRIGPLEIKFGRRILLRADELRDWVDAGCPNRRAWRWRPNRRGGAA